MTQNERLISQIA